MNTTIYPFSTELEPELGQVGGKALSLILLTKQNLPIPTGIALSVDFFTPWMEEIKKSDVWKDYLAADQKDLKAHCDALKTLAKELTLTEHQNAELNTHLDQLPKDCFWAVRSSSPEEDLEGTSFAGGYESVLAVTNESMQSAILTVFASVFDLRIVQYKLQNKMPIDDPKIAVIIQLQLASDMSGVAFSLNPQNNCYDEAVINASIGLGESVVSGQVIPDSYIVDKVNHSILETKIGKKEVSIIPNEKGGTKEIKNEDPFKQVLSENEILQVTKLVCAVEDDFNKPMDIEWAFQDGKLYLLQARPITAYFDLIPDMVTDPNEPKKLYMDFIIATQGFSDQMSVLGLDVWAKMNYVGNGFPRGKDGLVWDIYGRQYLMISHVMNVSRPMFNGFISTDKNTKKIFNDLDESQFILQSKPKKLSWFYLKIAKHMLSLVGVWAPLKSLIDSQAALEDCKKINEEVWQSLNQDLVKSEKPFDQQVDMALTAFGRLLKSVGGLAAAMMAKSSIEKIFKNEPVAKDLLVDLAMNLPGNPTAEMGNLMMELASDPDFIATKGFNEFKTKLSKQEFSKTFLKNYQYFVDRYACRGAKEIDIATKRLSENPEAIFDQLKQLNISNNNLQSNHDRQSASYQKLCLLARKLGKEKKFKKLAKLHHDMMGYREQPKYNVVVATAILRKKAIHIAEKFVASNRLDHVEQIFDLNVAQIAQAESDQKLDLQKLRINNLKHYKPSERIKDWPKIIDSRGKIYRAKAEHKDGQLIGEPIASGIVRGKAKVLSSPYEKPVIHGEILVCRASEPSWAPVFINASGIVMEIGGPLQHGAIIAREYGLPCVSSVIDATNLIKDGDEIEVDGNNGVVQIINKAK